jgi:hypothetical protein
MITLKQILRWIAVVPGALLGAVIVMFPVHWVAMYMHHVGTPDPMITDEQGRGLLQSMPLESLERFGDALFVFGTLIGVGAFVAPRFHFATAIVLTLRRKSLRHACIAGRVKYKRNALRHSFPWRPRATKSKSRR